MHGFTFSDDSAFSETEKQNVKKNRGRAGRMSTFWKKHKLLVIGLPCVLLAAGIAFGVFRFKLHLDVKAAMDAGDHYLKDLDYEQAIASYQQVLEIDENNKEGNRKLAEAYDANQMPDYAEAIYRKMISADSTDPEYYEKLAELYMRQDQLEEAKALLEEARQNAPSQTIDELYYVTRPDVPVADHEQGDYTDRIAVTLTSSEPGELIYYTLDGKEPDTTSAIYEKPIILANGKTTLKAMVMNASGYQSDIAVYEYDIQIRDILVELKEPLIEQIIRERLQIPDSQPIYNDDIEQITELYIVGENIGSGEDSSRIYFKEDSYTVDGTEYSVYGNGQIATLDDLVYMPFLETVVAVYQPGLDIRALAQCQSIVNLSLAGDELTNSDLSVIAGMENLKKCNLGWNSIENLTALSGMTNLTSLGLWNNHIKDIGALSGLTTLEYLDFSVNEVTDLNPVSGLTALKQLWFYDNQVKDISPLKNLSALSVLMLRNNPIENPEEIKSIYPHLTKLDVDLLNLGGDSE